jgi:uncharacterized protein DUF4129
VLVPSLAAADTLTIGQYRDRLDQVRRTLVSARALAPSSRAALVTDARATLGATTGLALGTAGTLAVDDSALASLDTTDASLDAAIARLNAHIVMVSRIGAPAIDAVTADAKLRDIVAQNNASSGGADLLDSLTRLIYQFLSGLRGPNVDLLQLLPVIGALGLAVILFILATLGRALPERVRREVLVRGGTTEERADPSAHLRAADAALAAGHPRDAIHALFLYAITALSTREILRYDPALTDRELLARAVAIPHADALRDLVNVYERSWFGLRDPSVDEARRARELALRVAP